MQSRLEERHGIARGLLVRPTQAVAIVPTMLWSMLPNDAVPCRLPYCMPSPASPTRDSAMCNATGMSQIRRLRTLVVILPFHWRLSKMLIVTFSYFSER